ncbi:hypothetical protein P9112_007249 [Eukaryota sp. TZLM1-RC]
MSITPEDAARVIQYHARHFLLRSRAVRTIQSHMRRHLSNNKSPQSIPNALDDVPTTQQPPQSEPSLTSPHTESHPPESPRPQEDHQQTLLDTAEEHPEEDSDQEEEVVPSNDPSFDDASLDHDDVSLEEDDVSLEEDDVFDDDALSFNDLSDLDDTSTDNVPYSTYLPTWSDVLSLDIEAISQQCFEIPAEVMKTQQPFQEDDKVLAVLDEATFKLFKPSNSKGNSGSKNVKQSSPEARVFTKATVPKSLDGGQKEVKNGLKQKDQLKTPLPAYSNVTPGIRKGQLPKNPQAQKLPPLNNNNLSNLNELNEEIAATPNSYMGLHLKKQKFSSPSPVQALQTRSSLQKRISQRKPEKLEKIRII